MRVVSIWVLLVVCMSGMLRPALSVGQTAGTRQVRTVTDTAPSTVTQPPGNTVGQPQRFFYMGVSSCGANTCHGAASARQSPVAGISQAEYTHWLSKDKHAKAYEVLRAPRSLQIAANLALREPPAQSERCLVCHTLYVPKDVRGPLYQLSEGVSCEACHGQAEGWLGTHIGHGYGAARAAGMYDTRNLVQRAEKCASCHVGDETREVNHELIAAGHPELVFELEVYTAMLPPHWRPSPNDGVGGRAWAVGQAVTLRASLQRLERRNTQRAAPAWPEFAELECATCHHEVRNIESAAYVRNAEQRLQEATLPWQPSWRQQRPTATLGLPAWNPARSFIFRQLLQVLFPAARVRLEQELHQVHLLLIPQGVREPARLAAAAHQAAQVVEALVPQMLQLTLTPELAQAVLRTITGEGEAIAAAGNRTAEQAALAVETFASLARKQGRPLTQEPGVTQALQQLFHSLRATGEWDQEPLASDTTAQTRSARGQFLAQMRVLHSVVSPREPSR